MLSDTRKTTVLFEGSQVSPVCPSDKSSIKMTTTEHWWNDTNRGKPKCSEKKKTCPSITLSTIHLTWTDLRSNPGLRGETGTRLYYTQYIPIKFPPHRESVTFRLEMQIGKKALCIARIMRKPHNVFAVKPRGT